MKRLFVVLFALVSVSSFAQWKAYEDTDPMTDEHSVVFYHISEGYPEKMIVLRYKGLDLDVFIDWGEYFSDSESNPMDVRFGKGEIKQMYAIVSANNTGLFFLEPEKILVSMLESPSAVFRATPWSESPRTLIVDCEPFQKLYAEYKDKIK